MQCFIILEYGTAFWRSTWFYVLYYGIIFFNKVTLWKVFQFYEQSIRFFSNVKAFLRTKFFKRLIMLNWIIPKRKKLLLKKHLSQIFHCWPKCLDKPKMHLPNWDFLLLLVCKILQFQINNFPRTSVFHFVIIVREDKLLESWLIKKKLILYSSRQNIYRDSRFCKVFDVSIFL